MESFFTDNIYGSVLADLQIPRYTGKTIVEAEQTKPESRAAKRQKKREAEKRKEKEQCR